MRQISVLLMILLFSSMSIFGQSADLRFEEGLLKANAEGDLKAAVVIFQNLVAEKNVTRPLKAKAQLQIGICYEKLGFKQAEAAFRSVLEEYPEQDEVVQAAKEKLARLEAASVLTEKEDTKLTHKNTVKQPQFKKMRIPANPGNGVLSPDGKKLAFTSGERLWTLPVPGKVQPDLAGEPFPLTEPMGARNMDGTLAWSADGMWIAFNTRINDQKAIYVVSSEGGDPIKVPIVPNQEGHPYSFRLALSPDGSLVAFSTRHEEDIEWGRGKDSYFICTFPVLGGEKRIVTDHFSREPAFSPDGKRVAYVKGTVPENDEPSRTGFNVWVTAAAGGNPVQVCDCAPGRARSPIWSPDGSKIAFLYEKPDAGNRSESLWIIPVLENGTPGGPVQKVKLPMVTEHMITGWTPDGKIALQLMNPEHNAVYSVPASGGRAAQVSQHCAPENPRYAPDGKTIFFLDEGKIVSIPVEGGQNTRIPFGTDPEIFESMPGGSNDISPRGDKIVFSGAKKVIKDGQVSWKVDIYTMTTDGKDLKKIIQSPTQDRFPCWSPDGRHIAFIRVHGLEEGKWISNIFLVSSEGGEVRQITSDTDEVNWACIDWAPDGRSIAFFSKDKSIKVIPAEGGNSTTLSELKDLNSHYELAWSPDGNRLAYTCEGKIWSVESEGGIPTEINTGLSDRSFKITWSPDGKRIGFTHWEGGDHELWLMSDFEP